MAYATPATQTTGDVIGAAAWNTLVDDIIWLAESGADGAPFCWAFRSTDQLFVTSVGGAISFNDEVVDNAGCHSTAVNPSRFTAPVDGWYRFAVGVKWQGNVTGSRYINLTPNGTTLTTSGASTNAAGLLPVGMSAEAHVRLTAGEYIEASALQNSGGNLNVLGHDASTTTGSWACFEWIRTY